MSSSNSAGHGPMGKPVTMTDRLEFIQGLLQETRDEQRKGNALLADLRVEVAVLQRMHSGQEQRIDAFRAEAERRHSELEGRVRALEGDGREVKVVARSAGAIARDVVRYAITALGGALVAGAVWAVKHGGPPG